MRFFLYGPVTLTEQFLRRDSLAQAKSTVRWLCGDTTHFTIFRFVLHQILAIREFLRGGDHIFKKMTTFWDTFLKSIWDLPEAPGRCWMVPDTFLGMWKL